MTVLPLSHIVKLLNILVLCFKNRSELIAQVANIYIYIYMNYATHYSQNLLQHWHSLSSTADSTGVQLSYINLCLHQAQLSYINLKSGCSQRDVLALFLPYYSLSMVSLVQALGIMQPQYE